MKVSALLAAASLLVPLASAVTYVTASGGEFINNATGDRLDIIGVTYVSAASMFWLQPAVPEADGGWVKQIPAGRLVWV